MTNSALVVAGMLSYAFLGAISMKIINDAQPPKVVEREVVVQREVVQEKEVVRFIPVNEDVVCLAHNIFHEARGEAEAGQVQVAFVTLNRVASRRYPNTVCGVVHQRAQFSWTFDNPHIDLSDPIERAAYMRAMSIAAEVISGARDAENTGATHYYNPDKVSPGWADELSLVGVLGDHRFLR